MKRTLPHLELGDQVYGTLVEKISSQYWIVSFYGDLVRIKNISPRTFQVGEKIPLKVQGINPLKFILA